MYQVLAWISNNREWFLSGIGIAIPLAIIGWVYSRRDCFSKLNRSSNSLNINTNGNVIFNGNVTQETGDHHKRTSLIKVDISNISVGLLITLLAVLIVNHISPDNIKAQISAGSIGIVFIVYAQLPQLLPMMPGKHRALFTLSFFAIY